MRDASVCRTDLGLVRFRSFVRARFVARSGCSRHGQAWHRKSSLLDLRRLRLRTSGKPELRCHPRLGSGKGVDARDTSASTTRFCPRMTVLAPGSFVTLIR